MIEDVEGSNCIHCQCLMLALPAIIVEEMIVIAVTTIKVTVTIN